MESLCKTCRYADIAKKERTIIKQGMRIKQGAGSVICTRSYVKSISLADGKTTCSDYEEDFQNGH